MYENHNLPQPIIKRNAARCYICSKVIESRHVHEYVSCDCGAIFVDGGIDYIRRGGDFKQMEDLSEVIEFQGPQWLPFNQYWQSERQARKVTRPGAFFFGITRGEDFVIFN